MRLAPQDERMLLSLALRAVRAAVSGGTESWPKDEAVSAAARAPAGAFVTLHGPGEALRGCIGSVQARAPLFRTVIEMAEAAACRDPRFEPVRPEEVAGLALEISVLTPLEDLPSPPDPVAIRIGQDGLYVSQGGRGGLLLPQVASREGWDARRFLDHTCRKAGLPADAWRKGARVQRFQAAIFGASVRELSRS